jgi:hypothetical protein
MTAIMAHECHLQFRQDESIHQHRFRDEGLSNDGQVFVGRATEISAYGAFQRVLSSTSHEDLRLPTSSAIIGLCDDLWGRGNKRKCGFTLELYCRCRSLCYGGSGNSSTGAQQEDNCECCSGACFFPNESHEPVEQID